MIRIKKKEFLPPPYEILSINNSSSPLGEKRGEGLPARELSKELHLTPNPSVLDFLHARFCRCFLHSASRNFKPRYPEFHSVRKSAPKGEGRKCAFTLAETLITLVIIGVIAALTVPTMITKYQKEQTVIRLKKVYSTLSQTTNRAIADNGPVSNWELGEVNNPDDMILFINRYMAPYLSFAKKPEKLENNNWNPISTYLNGSDATYDSTYVRFYLSDGSSVTCRIVTNNDTNRRVMMRVDINGDKKPNKFSRDIFSFDYYLISSDVNRSGKFVPSGMEQITRENLLSDSPYQCNKNQVGVSCAALIMKDGWQISDDYPW